MKSIQANFYRSSVSAQSRDRSSIGKIIKNKPKLKTQISVSALNQTILSNYSTTLNSSMSRQKIFSTTGSNSKYTLKNQQSLESYEQKLWRYEKNKREVLKDIGRINFEQGVQKKEQISKINYVNRSKKDSFQCKLKYSLKSSILNTKLDTSLSEEEQKASKTNCFRYYRQVRQKQKQMEGLEERQKKKFILEMDKQIRLQNKLRKIKLQLKPTHKKYIKQHMSLPCSHLYNLDKLTNLTFEQFQLCTDLKEKENYLDQENVSSETLSTILIEVYELCERNWKQNIHRKFSKEFVNNLFHHIHYSNQAQVDFKSFVRQFNILFSRNYQPKEMFRIYERIAPLKNSHFLYIFSI